MSDNEEKKEVLTIEEIEEADNRAKDLAAQSNMALQAYIATSSLLAGTSAGITDEAILVALNALAKSARMIMKDRGGWKDKDLDILDQVADKMAQGLANPEKIAQLIKDTEDELRAAGLEVPDDTDEEDALDLLMGAPVKSTKLLKN